MLFKVRSSWFSMLCSRRAARARLCWPVLLLVQVLAVRNSTLYSKDGLAELTDDTLVQRVPSV